MKIEYEIYIVEDSWGNTDYDVVKESANTIQICGMKDAKGENQYFESDAYHLQRWCDEHGFKYRHTSMSEIF